MQKETVAKSATHDLIDRLWKVEDLLRERDPQDPQRDILSGIINTIQELQKGTIEIYKAGGQWRFTQYGDNGEIIGSGEAYINKKDMLQTIRKYFPTFQVTEKKKMK